MIRTLKEWLELKVGLSVYYDNVYIQRWEYKQYEEEVFEAIDIRRIENKLFIALSKVN